MIVAAKPFQITKMDADSPSSAKKKKMIIPLQGLQKLIQKQTCGRLIVTDPNDESVQWRVYVGHGKLHFANSVNGQYERLSYLLQHHFPNLPLPESEGFVSDYQAICQIWKSGELSIQKTRQLLLQLTQEGLIQFLALPRAEVRIEKPVGLDPLLLSLPVNATIRPLRSQIRAWIQVRSDIASPFSRLHLETWEGIVDLSWVDIHEYELLESFKYAFEQNLCLYEVAAQHDITPLDLAIFLQPFVKAGVVEMLPYHKIQVDNRPVIACVDDSKTVQHMVKFTLERSGFRVIGLEDPTQALKILIHHKPDLILMDIDMPGIDGYELCRIIQQSHQLKDIPIVMLTGRNGLVDRIRARLVGAVSYVSKPFDPQQLLTIISSKLYSG